MGELYTDYIERWGPTDAVLDETKSLKYPALREQAARAATYLRQTCGSGEYVLLRAHSSVEFVVTLLGLIYSGNVPIPVDPDSPAALLQRLSVRARSHTTIDPLPATSFSGLTPTFRADPALPCLVMFTSGTSGDPKGVVITHRNLIHACEAVSEYLDYRRYPSTAIVLPLHYSYGLLSQLLCQLMIGGRCRLLSGLRNPWHLEEAVNAGELATFCGVPSTYVAIAKAHRMRPMNMPCVKVLCSAGAAMNASVLPIVKNIFPNAEFFNNYGMTEAAPRIAYISESDRRFSEPRICGRPIRGVEVKIVHPEAHTELPAGEEGMLAVRGPNIMDQYLNDPERTARAFTPDGYLITGDMGRIDRGYIFLSGRYDDLFNVGGEKVSPIEIERALNQIKQIDVSAVRGVADENRGAIPIAFVILSSPIAKAELLAKLERELSPVSMPRRIYAVSSLPMTPNGKLQRKMLSSDADYVLHEIK